MLPTRRKALDTECKADVEFYVTYPCCFNVVRFREKMPAVRQDAPILLVFLAAGTAYLRSLLQIYLNFSYLEAFFL